MNILDHHIPLLSDLLKIGIIVEKFAGSSIPK